MDPLIIGTVVFENVCPENVSVFSSGEIPEEFELLAAERQATRSFSQKRMLDFKRGRYCARMALAHVGRQHEAISVGASREPVWPDGIIGSISHCDGTSAAAVCAGDDLLGIGIDMETLQVLEPVVLDQICGPEEVQWMANHHTDRQFSSVVFCIKEAIYKSVWPNLRRFVEFREVSVIPELGENTFVAKSASRSLSHDLIARVSGFWAISSGRIFAYAACARPGPTETSVGQ